MKRPLQDIADAVGARLIGDGSVSVNGVSSIATASRDDLVFVEDEKYLVAALQSHAGAVIAPESAASISCKTPLLISDHPKLAFARAARLLSAAEASRVRGSGSTRDERPAMARPCTRRRLIKAGAALIGGVASPAIGFPTILRAATVTRLKCVTLATGVSVIVDAYMQAKRFDLKNDVDLVAVNSYTSIANYYNDFAAGTFDVAIGSWDTFAQMYGRGIPIGLRARRRRRKNSSALSRRRTARPTIEELRGKTLAAVQASGSYKLSKMVIQDIWGIALEKDVPVEERAEPRPGAHHDHGRPGGRGAVLGTERQRRHRARTGHDADLQSRRRLSPAPPRGSALFHLCDRSPSTPARDAWLANMKAAVREVGDPGRRGGSAHGTPRIHGARALVNTGETPEKVPCPSGTDRFDARLAEQWNQMAEVENLFDAVSHGDLALLRSMLPLRLVPHAVLMSHALVEWLDPTGRADRRFGRRPKRVKPLDVIECLLAHRNFDRDPDEGDERADIATFRR